MLILGGGRIHAHFGSEVGITSGNADPGGGRICTHFGSEVGITSGNADPGGGSGQSALTLEVKF